MIYISKFRSNDLNPSKGKQIEFNKTVIDNFFEFTDREHIVTFECYSILHTDIKENIRVELKLSPSRGDYKIYQNSDGSKDLKDYFLETLHLKSDENLGDYFAIKKKTSAIYILYYIPKSTLFSNFFSIASSDQFLFIPEDLEKTEEKPETLIPRQIIYYGAPGTGKSHSVKRETEEWEKKGRVVRTTFHPDSDYSTFVGAYKPTTESVQRYDIYNKPITKDGQPVMEQVITYEFVAQAFLHAYINAWKNREEPEFLIIEEINRGNCAQIFGDLFQLLDRGDDGYSEYSVRADKDLQKHLTNAFADVVLDDYPKVKSGEVLILPKNLYLRATMNTSDQSLFPIDSAFKRRWDWKYIPIAKGKDNDGVELNWMIVIDDKRYDWWTFVKTINKHVFDTTNSEDKQLGFFFCKAKGDIIDVETFVSKVVFYLWNDVFKDFGFDAPIFADKEDETNPKLSFDKFYMANGEVNKDKIKIFLANIGMIPMEETVEDDEDESADSSSVKIPKYSINGSSEQFTTPQAVRRIIEDYAKRNESISVNEMIELWNGISERNNLLVDSWQPSPNDNQPFANKRRTKIEWKNGVVWVTNGWTEALFKKFMDNVKQRLGINILKVN